MHGTYETATLRSEDIWPYNPDTKEKFATKNMKRKGFSEGIDQIKNTPEIAPVVHAWTATELTAAASGFRYEIRFFGPSTQLKLKFEHLRSLPSAGRF